MDNRVALAKVSFSGGANCFVGVTKNIARLVSPSSAPSRHHRDDEEDDDDVVVFELLFEKTIPPVYVSWSGEVIASPFDVITINDVFGASLGLSHGREVIVRPLPPATTLCRKLTLEPASANALDYTGDRIRVLRSLILSQIRVVQPNLVIAVWPEVGEVVSLRVSVLDPETRPVKLDDVTEIRFSWIKDAPKSDSRTARQFDPGNEESPFTARLPLPFFSSSSSRSVTDDDDDDHDDHDDHDDRDDSLSRLESEKETRRIGSRNVTTPETPDLSYDSGVSNKFTRSISDILDSVGSVESLVSLPYSSDEDDSRLIDDEFDDDNDVDFNDSLVKKISDRLTPDPLLTNLFAAVSRELANNINPISAATAAATASRDAIYGRFLDFWAAVATSGKPETMTNLARVDDDDDEDSTDEFDTRFALQESVSESASMLSKFWNVVSFMAPSMFQGSSVPAIAGNNATASTTVPGPGSLFSDNAPLASFNRFHREILRQSLRVVLRVQPMNDARRSSSKTTSMRQRTPDLRARFSRHASLETAKFNGTVSPAAEKSSSRASSLALPVPDIGNHRSNSGDASDPILSSVSKFLFCGLKLVWRQPNTLHVHVSSLPATFSRKLTPSNLKSFIVCVSHVRPPYKNRDASREQLAAKLQAVTKANLLSAGDVNASSSNADTSGSASSAHPSLLFSRYARVIVEDDDEDEPAVPNNNNNSRDILRPDDTETCLEYPLPGHATVPDWIRRHFSCGATDRLLVTAAQNLPCTGVVGLDLTPLTLINGIGEIKDEDVIVRFRQWVSSISSEDHPFVVSNPTFVEISLSAHLTFECTLTFRTSPSVSSSTASFSDGYCLIPPSQLNHLIVTFHRVPESPSRTGTPIVMPEDSLFGYPSVDVSSISPSSSKWSFAIRRIAGSSSGSSILKSNAWSSIGLREAFRGAVSHVRLSLGLDPVHRHQFGIDGPQLVGRDAKLAIHSRGCLLITGKSGVGKTRFAQSIASHFASSPSLARVVWVDCVPMRGRKSDAVLRDFDDKLEEAVFHEPSILVLDDLDALLPASGESSEDGGNESPANLAIDRLSESIIDALSAVLQRREAICVVITAPSRHALHESLTTGSSGRRLIRRVVSLHPPATTECLRAALRLLMDTRFGHAAMETAEDEEKVMELIGRRTEGFVMRDLERVVERAIHACKVRRRETSAMEKEQINRNVKNPSSTPQLSTVDFDAALEGFAPSALKTVALHTPPVVKWEDVGGLKTVKRKLVQFLEWPTKYPELMKKCPLNGQTGILLFGPPGSGKTYVAGAAAHECGLRFISVKGPELLSKYVGESEKAVRATFDRARAARPCLLFFDEFDSLAPRRGNDSTGVTDRVVNQLLTQLDGVEGRQGITVLAATSRPDLVDPALLRPGRLGKRLFCPLPDEKDRLEILEIHREKLSKKTRLDPEVNLSWIATFCAGFSGADLKALLFNAQMESYDDQRRENGPTEKRNEEKSDQSFLVIGPKHVDKALIQTKPSVTEKEVAMYGRVYAEFFGANRIDAKNNNNNVNNNGDAVAGLKSIFDRKGERQTLA